MFSIKDILVVLEAKLRLIIIFAIIGGILGGLYTAVLIDPQYHSVASMYVSNQSARNSDNISSGELAASKTLVNTCIVIIKSDSTMELVAEDLHTYGYDMSVKELRKSMVVLPIDDTETFQITVTNTNPELAQLITNSIVKIAPERILKIVEAGCVKVIDYASTPDEKNYPLGTNIVIGLIIGFGAMVMVILIKAFFDTKVHDEEQLRDVFEIPVIGVVPKYNDEIDVKS